jgi:hypothetical protein
MCAVQSVCSARHQDASVEVTILDTFVPWLQKELSNTVKHATPSGVGPDMNQIAAKLGFKVIYGSELSASQAREVRCAVRFPLALPVSIVHEGESRAAMTCNISASGVLFETEAPFSVGEPIVFAMQMPGTILGTPKDVLVECRGRVVRCSLSNSLPRVAATIDDYRFVEQ